MILTSIVALNLCFLLVLFYNHTESTKVIEEVVIQKGSKPCCNASITHPSTLSNQPWNPFLVRNRKQPTTPNIESDPLFASALIGCDCPLGYVLVIKTTQQNGVYNAYCQSICFDAVNVTCSTPGQYGECIGPIISLPNCNLGSQFGPLVCRSGGGTCGDFVASNGDYYCINFTAGTPNPIPTTCAGTSFSATCAEVFDPTCTTNVSTLFPLTLLKCTCSPLSKITFDSDRRYDSSN